MGSLAETWRLRGDLDIALLRTFVAVIDLGGVARAANYIGRSQPATSLQLKRLQEDLGTLLFRKAGRGLELTEAGVKLAPLARRLVGLHDQTLAAVTEDQLSGQVRIGIVEDFAEDWLTGLLARFSSSHPTVSIEVHTDRRVALMDRFKAGMLDLLLTLGETVPPEARDLGAVSVCWIGSEATDLNAPDNVPLVLLDAPCMFRDMALAAFAAAGRNYRLAYTSHSVATQWSAVRAGLGVSLRTPIGIKRPLMVIEPGDFVPTLPAIPLHLLLFQAAPPDNKPVNHLLALLHDTVRAAGFVVGKRVGGAPHDPGPSMASVRQRG